MKRFVASLLLIVAISLLVAGCIRIAQTVPAEGVWHCAELEITVNCKTKYCSIVIDGQKIKCAFSNDRGSRGVSVVNQDTSATEYYLGKALFEGECVYYDETTMVICERFTEKNYTFYKIESQTDDFLA